MIGNPYSDFLDRLLISIEIRSKPFAFFFLLTFLIGYNRIESKKFHLHQIRWTNFAMISYLTDKHT